MELEEIELVLEQLPEVLQAVITPIKKGEKVQYLHATVIPANPKIEDVNEMIMHLKHELKIHLPEYMIPRNFSFVDDLPLTANGKLDRNKVSEGLKS
ncbi:AMP-binding enzyme [Mammaliicoccus vitulinus]